MSPIHIKPSIDNKKSNLITSASHFPFPILASRCFLTTVSRASHFAASFCESISFFISFSPSFTPHRKAFTTEK
uniref:Uncharacterized protein n=1 Tax=Solanum lycopersicum TaxID=4081 RepID=A0A3Q7GEP2_SOLLC